MRRVSLALVALLLAACGETQDEAAVALRPDSVAMALEQYDPVQFDTITWASDSAQTNRGDVVWAFSCKKCHGLIGRGDANLVVAGDTIRTPDFTTSWRFGSDEKALVKYIFAGNDRRMPHWGIEGLKARDIDAVAVYVLRNLVGINKFTVQTPSS